MDRIYLDNNATTRTDPLVLEAMAPFLGEAFGNPSSVHAEGRRARAALHRARADVARALGADPEEIVFTSGGTESDGLAIQGLARARRREGRGQVIVSSVEHEAVLEAALLLGEGGLEVTLLPVDGGGRVDPGDLERAMRPDAVLVSVMGANNEVGTLQPVEELSRVCRERAVAFHSDAVQVLGRIPLDVRALHVDALSLSGHKIHGPKGAGLLFLRRGTPFETTARGGGQEGGRRCGTENVAAIVGLARAVELAIEHREEATSRWKRQTGAFLDRIENAVPGVHQNGPREHRIQNTLNLSFDGVEAESLVIGLDLAGVAASAGSACASGSLEPSHVLRAMGLPPERVRGAVRFSLSRNTTDEELRAASDRLCAAVESVRGARRPHAR